MLNNQELACFIKCIEKKNPSNSPMDGNTVISIGNMVFKVNHSSDFLNFIVKEYGYLQLVDGHYIISKKGFKFAKKQSIVNFFNTNGNFILILIGLVTLGFILYQTFKPSQDEISKKSSQERIQSTQK